MDNRKRICMMLLLVHNGTVMYGTSSSESQKNKKREIEYTAHVQSGKSDALWAGIIGGCLGAAAGVALGHWLTSSDTVFITEPVVPMVSCPMPTVLSAQEYKLQMQIEKFAKYGQNFDFSNTEQAIVMNLYKLGFRPGEDFTHIYQQLALDLRHLNGLGYSVWWHGAKVLENQKNLYLSTCKKLQRYFTEHETFIKGCYLICQYDELPEYPSQLISWVYKHYHGKQIYPLIAYKNKVEKDYEFLTSFQCQIMIYPPVEPQYPLLTRQAALTATMLQDVIELVCSSQAYQQELFQKRQDELIAEQNRLEKERLEIARRHAQALEEANRLAAERNKLDKKSYYDDIWDCLK